MTRLVVVGNGMVGARFVEDILAADADGRFRITVLGAEECEPYNRVLLSEVVAGTYGLADLTLPSPAHDRLSVLRGQPATRIDREDRAVMTADGSRHRYDQLVLATGSAARIPPIPGLGASPGSLPAGVHPLRSIDDAREIVAATLNARRAVVLGAGVLGLEAACGLARRGIAVTVVHPAAALMERQLDESASGVVQATLQRLGIDHRVGVGAEEVLVDDRRRLRGLRLSDGEVVDAELLVLATGTMANTALAQGAGLRTERGIVVTEALASPDDARIFAIGDCAQPPGGGTGLVAQGWDQSRQLAAALAGAGSAARGSGGDAGTDVVRLKAHGLDVVTMGVCGSDRQRNPGHRTLQLSDPAAGRHVEVVVDGGRLVGATCIGAGSVAADLLAAYTRHIPVPQDPAQLLLSPVGRTAPVPSSPADLADTATVCRCNSVSKADIVAHWEAGCGTVEEVAAATRATTGCGGCRQDVCGLLDWLGSASPSPDSPREDRLTHGKHALHGTEIKAG